MTGMSLQVPPVPLFSGEVYKRGGTNTAFKKRWLTITSHAELMWHASKADAASGAQPKG